MFWARFQTRLCISSFCNSSLQVLDPLDPFRTCFLILDPFLDQLLDSWLTSLPGPEFQAPGWQVSFEVSFSVFKFGFSNWSNLGHLNLNTQRLNISMRICPQCVGSTSTIIPLGRLFQSRHCPICRFKISSQMFSKFIVQTFTNSFIRFKTIGLRNALPCFGSNRRFFENLSTSERFKMDLVLFSKIVK